MKVADVWLIGYATKIRSFLNANNMVMKMINCNKYLFACIVLGSSLTSTSYAGSDYLKNNNATVTNRKLNLMWARCPIGQELKKNSCEENDYGPSLKWMEANKLANESSLAGFTDWRLPTIEEIKGLMDLTHGEFQDLFPTNFWESPPSDWVNNSLLTLTTIGEVLGLFYMRGSEHLCQWSNQADPEDSEKAMVWSLVPAAGVASVDSFSKDSRLFKCYAFMVRP